MPLLRKACRRLKRRQLEKEFGKKFEDVEMCMEHIGHVFDGVYMAIDTFKLTTSLCF
jgi:hypothetical protein